MCSSDLGCAIAQGCEYKIEKMGEAVDLINDEEMVEVLRKAAGAVKGVTVRDDPMNFGGSEDATIIARRVQAKGGKAAFFVLGADRPSGHHTAKFDIRPASDDSSNRKPCRNVRCQWEELPTAS